MIRRAAVFVLTLLFAGSGLPAAEGGGLVEETFLRIRVQESAGETVADVPRKLLDAMGPTGATVPIGRWKGRDLRLSVDRVIRDLRTVPASGVEKVILSRTTDAGNLRITAKSVVKRVPPRDSGPLWLDAVFQRLDGSRQRVQTALPLAAVPALGPALSQLAGAPLDPEVLPLLDEAFRAARSIGSGPVLDARAPWARLILTTR
jgi:hypothetical protein